MSNLKLRNETDKYAFAQTCGMVSIYHPAGYKIPDDEPVLIFRAKDLGVLSAIAAYMDMLCEQEPSGTIRDHLISMLSVSMNILKYQKNKSIKSVTCSLTAHRSTVSSLNKEVEKSINFAIEMLIKTYGLSVDEINKIANKFDYPREASQ